MVERCTDPKNNRFLTYGARGITVCPEWLKSFERFLEDMGLKPSSLHSIERKDNNGSYSPDNCVWATAAEQARNRRSVRRIQSGDIDLCLKDWANRLSVPIWLLYRAFALGYSLAYLQTGQRRVSCRG